MKKVVLILLIAVVSSEASAGFGGVMRAQSGKIHQVIAHGALAILLCTGSACAPLKITSESNATVAEPVVEQEMPLVEERPAIEKTAVDSTVNTPLGAIDFLSVGRYLTDKDTLTAEFYDNMFVHYLDDGGNDYTALVTLVDGKLLASHNPHAQQNEIAKEQIEGVLIAGDPLAGSVAGVLSTDILAINGIELSPQKMELQLVGTINQIFTSNYYQLHVRGFFFNGELITRPLDRTGIVFVHGDDLWFMPSKEDGTAQISSLDILARLP